MPKSSAFYVKSRTNARFVLFVGKLAGKDPYRSLFHDKNAAVSGSVFFQTEAKTTAKITGLLQKASGGCALSVHGNIQDESQRNKVNHHGGTTMTDKRKRDTRDRQKSDTHTHILYKVESI